MVGFFLRRDERRQRFVRCLVVFMEKREEMERRPLCRHKCVWCLLVPLYGREGSGVHAAVLGRQRLNDVILPYAPCIGPPVAVCRVFVCFVWVCVVWPQSTIRIRGVEALRGRQLASASCTCTMRNKVSDTVMKAVNQNALK